MLTDPRQVAARQAAEALEDIARLQRHTRRSLGTPWFPLLCFGAVNVLSAPLVAVAGGAVLAPLWIVAGGAAMFLTSRHYRHRAERSGVTGHGRRVWLVAIAMFVSCLAAGIVAGTLAGQAAGLLGPIVVVLTGYIIIGWVQHSAIPPLAVGPPVALAAVLAATGQAPWVVELAFGGALMLVGIGLRVAAARA
jgi:hypothetical protein